MDWRVMQVNWIPMNCVLQRLALAGAILALCCGCGRSNSKLAEVSGRVTYNGEPFPGVHLEFNPDGPGRPSSGYTDQNGEYTARYTEDQNGALIGKHEVLLKTYDDPATAVMRVPADYAKMEFEVKPGSNRFDVDIQANP
jgi:hypothetical protein